MPKGEFSNLSADAVSCGLIVPGGALRGTPCYENTTKHARRCRARHPLTRRDLVMFQYLTFPLISATLLPGYVSNSSIISLI